MSNRQKAAPFVKGVAREIQLTRGEALLAALSLVIWLGLMAHLALTRVIPWQSQAALLAAASDPEELVRDWTDVEEYMVVRNGRTPVGAASTMIKRLPEGAGFEVNFRLGMDLNLLGMRRSIEALAVADLNARFHLERFSARFEAAPVVIQANGRIADSFLYLEIFGEDASAPTRRLIALDRPISLLEAATPAATRRIEVRPGARYSIPVVDPLWSLSYGTAGLEVKEPVELQLGQSPPVTAHPVEMTLGDFKTTMYIDADGRVLRRRLIGTYTLDAATRQEAKNRGPVVGRTFPITQVETGDFASISATSLPRLDAGQNQSPIGLLQSLIP